MVMMFVDMKAAFNSMDREILLKDNERKREMKEGCGFWKKVLVVRCEEVLKETMSRVRVGEEKGEDFE